jgi:hypothetical protein
MMWLADQYAGYLNRWEAALCFRATNRVVRDFEWGLDWAERWPVAKRGSRNGHAPEQYLRLLNRQAIAQSEDFFGYRTPADFELYGSLLRFTSPVWSPYAENNVVHGQWFPARNSDRAMLVLPHWNAPRQAHNAVARALQRLGISALRLSLPYHDYRMPAELERADYAVSSNLGRTIDAARQAVIDIRAALDWLETRGARRLGIIGTSLGSCYAFLAAAHDPRLTLNVFNHCSTFFADVVWTGLSTLHVKRGLQDHLDLERLRALWLAISPSVYFDKYAAHPRKSKFIYARYDTTFLPGLSAETVRMAAEYGLDHEVVVLPCGHYTLGEAPFKYLDGWHICAFVKTHL